jgi:hypothetical protein
MVRFVSTAIRFPSFSLVRVVDPCTMTVLAVTDSEEIEARATAMVFQILLQKTRQEQLVLDFTLANDALVALQSQREDLLMTIFVVSSGSLNSPLQLAKLSSLRRSVPGHRTLSVITTGSFQFPSKSYLQQLAVGEQVLSEADLQLACRKCLITPPLTLVDVACALRYAFAVSIAITIDMQRTNEDSLALGIRFLADRIGVIKGTSLSASQQTDLSREFTDSTKGRDQIATTDKDPLNIHDLEIQLPTDNFWVLM